MHTIVAIPDIVNPLLRHYTSIIGLTYDFGPDGATFNPPVLLEFGYDSSSIPAGVNKGDLSIAYHDKNAAKWVKLESTINPAANTVTASISHFTAFAILGRKAAAPARFTPSSLAISPTEVAPAQPVTISILVANAGGQSANYKAVLKIGGEVEAITEPLLFMKL